MHGIHGKITIGTHFFKITHFDDRLRDVIYKFLGNYVKYGLEKIPRSNRYKKVATAVYATRTLDKNEFRFHINQYSKFIQLMEANLVPKESVEIVTLDICTASPLDCSVKDGWVPREDQTPVLDYLIDSPYRSKLVGIQTGKGKDQPLTAKIKTPKGWTTMGDINVGDDVISRDGTSTKVIAIHPKETRDVYKITFYDGRQTECGAGHLWKVFNVNVTKDKRWKLIDTEEIIRLLNNHNPRLYVELIEPQKSKDIELPIDPYVLGVILGDAHIGKYLIDLATPDDFILDEVSKRLPKDLIINRKGYCNNSIIINKQFGDIKNNSLTKEFRNLNLSEKLSYEKFIPDVYLNGSIKQRLELLQGLMDTDGTVNVDGNISFCSSSKKLAEQVQYLVRSLGGLAKISIRQPFYTYKDKKIEAREAYQLNIRVKNPNNFFLLPRKKNKTPTHNQYSDDLKSRIKSVDYVGKKVTQCITIDHPEQLYVTDDFIVTHNSFLSMYAASKLNKKIAIVVRPMFIFKWVGDVAKYLNIDTAKQVMVVQGMSQLMMVFEQQKLGLLDDIKIFIFSNKTLQLWFKQYQEFGEAIRDQGYGITPEEMYSHLKIGLRLIDEVHLDFHLNFKIDLYTNVEHSISLSATLDNKDQFQRDMYELAYPISQRFKEQEIDKYAIARCVIYSIDDNPDKIRSTEYGSKSYSHNAFEEYIMKKPQRLENYLRLIKHTIDVGYMQDYVPGERCVVFAYRKDFCTIVVNYLNMKYPNLDIRRYVSEDPDENMYDPDIRVTTLGSGSTGHDIAMLKAAIMTVNVESLQANIQAFGRLRKLDKLTPRFYYFTCLDVQKHMQYHKLKMEILQKRALNFNIFQSPFRI